MAPSAARVPRKARTLVLFIAIARRDFKSGMRPPSVLVNKVIRDVRRYATRRFRRSDLIDPSGHTKGADDRDKRSSVSRSFCRATQSVHSSFRLVAHPAAGRVERRRPYGGTSPAASPKRRLLPGNPSRKCRRARRGKSSCLSRRMARVVASRRAPRGNVGVHRPDHPKGAACLASRARDRRQSVGTPLRKCRRPASHSRDDGPSGPVPPPPDHRSPNRPQGD